MTALFDSGRTGTWAESIVAAHSLASPELVLVEMGNILARFGCIVKWS